jgi:hypothetical protein
MIIASARPPFPLRGSIYCRAEWSEATCTQLFGRRLRICLTFGTPRQEDLYAVATSTDDLKPVKKFTDRKAAVALQPFSTSPQTRPASQSARCSCSTEASRRSEVPGTLLRSELKRNHKFLYGDR